MVTLRIGRGDGDGVIVDRDFVRKLIREVDLILLEPGVSASELRHAKYVGTCQYLSVAPVTLKISSDGEFCASEGLLARAQELWCLRTGTIEEAILCILASAAIDAHLISGGEATLQTLDFSLHLVAGGATIDVDGITVTLDVYSFARALYRAKSTLSKELATIARIISIMEGGDYNDKQ